MRPIARLLLPAMAVAGIAHAAPPAAVDCVAAADHQRLQQNYDDLFARFDLATVTQRLIDVSNECSDLKDQMAACRANSSKADGPQNCDAVAAQYAAKLDERKAAQDRLGTALDMDEYLLTLKLRLEKPLCDE